MSDLQRVPIVDKNGKATHVHKTLGDTSTAQSRIAAVTPQPTVESDIEVNPKDKAFPNITAVHGSGCACEFCEEGTTVNASTWEDTATVGDILAMLKSPDYVDPDDNDEGLVKNQSEGNKFDLLFNSYFSNTTSEDFVSRIREEFIYQLRRNSSVLAEHSGDPRFNDEYVAVDPNRCGCTECIIGLYIPEQDWTPYAQSGDISAVLSGDIGNNIGGTDFSLVFQNHFRNESAREFIKELEDEFDELVRYMDIDDLAERSHGY